MKKLFLLILGLIYPTIMLSQQTGKDIPVIIPITEDGKLYPRLEIRMDCIMETIEAVLSISLTFDIPFSDSMTIPAPEKITLETLSLYQGFVGLGTLRKDVKRRSARDNCIWNAVEAQFEEWLQDQPYSDMIDMEWSYGYNAVGLHYVVTLVPE